MTRAEEYDYNKFLSDSSDDYPKYGASDRFDAKDDQSEVHRNSHRMRVSVPVEDLNIALHNVLEIAREFLNEPLEEIYPLTDVERERIGRAIHIVADFKENLVDSNLALAKADS